MSVDVVEILKEPKMVKVCAPMVRYSKLQFRTLVRRYNCDICFTPMILADSFVLSAKARENEFSTNQEDTPLIVQFAAKKPEDFLSAAELVAPYCNGVDLNCGCPQRWAMKEGYGAELLKKPNLVKDLVYRVRNRIPGPFSVSVKLRLSPDICETVNLCQILEKTGVSFLTVHARTPAMRNEPIDIDALRTVRDCVRLPIIANGDVKSLDSAEMLYKETKCDAVMSARGILTNPALYSGYSVTPLSCVQDWIDITEHISTNFLCFHHHLVFMLEKVLAKKDRLFFNTLQNKADILKFLEDHYSIKPTTFTTISSPLVCLFDTSRIRLKDNHIGNYEDNLSNDFLGNIFVEP